MTIRGYVPGVFDMFHIGHLRILLRARDACDILIAGVVTDEVAQSVKGRYPIIPFAERVKIVEHLRIVDEVVADDQVEKDLMWERVRYDVLFKGSDWKDTEKGRRLETALDRYDAHIHYFPYTESTSSTQLRALVGDG